MHVSQAFDDLAILPVVAAAVFSLRQSEILNCHDRMELPQLFVGGGQGGGIVNNSLKVVPLITHFLFL